MGFIDVKVYFVSFEVVVVSVFKGKIVGLGWYQKLEGVEKVIIGEGNGDVVQDKVMSIEEVFDKLIVQVDSMIVSVEKEFFGDEVVVVEFVVEVEIFIEIFFGFFEKIEGEIVFCDVDNINIDGIYFGKYIY